MFSDTLQSKQTANKHTLLKQKLTWIKSNFSTNVKERENVINVFNNETIKLLEYVMHNALRGNVY